MGSGEAALPRPRFGGPADVALTDVDLSDIGGVALAREVIRPGGPDVTPVLSMAPLAGMPAMEDAGGGSVEDWPSKPVRVAVLRSGRDRLETAHDAEAGLEAGFDSAPTRPIGPANRTRSCTSGRA